MQNLPPRPRLPAETLQIQVCSTGSSEAHSYPHIHILTSPRMICLHPRRLNQAMNMKRQFFRDDHHFRWVQRPRCRSLCPTDIFGTQKIHGFDGGDDTAPKYLHISTTLTPRFYPPRSRQLLRTSHLGSSRREWRSSPRPKPRSC